MKIKRGFITNSSSSNFVFKLPLHINSIAKAAKYLKLSERECRYFFDGIQRPTRDQLIEEFMDEPNHDIYNKRIEKDILFDNERWVTKYEYLSLHRRISYAVPTKQIDGDTYYLSDSRILGYDENKLRPVVEEFVDELITKCGGIENVAMVEISDHDKLGSWIEHDWGFNSVISYQTSHH